MPRIHTPARRALPAVMIIAALIITAWALLLTGLSGCERAPAPPTFANPFDPLGPETGDPLDLRVVASGGLISLFWLQPQDMGIVEYVIGHAVHPDSTFTSLALVTHSTAIDNIYQYLNPTPTQTHWFRVQALDADGNASASDYATPAGVVVGPRVFLNEGGTTTASRFMTVNVIVSQGTTLRVALGPTYDVETTHAAAAPGDTAVIALDAGLTAQGDSVRVRVIATDGVFTSAPTIAKARVDFSPDFTLHGGGTVASSRTVQLDIPVSGVTQMRFASSEAGLSAAGWVPGAAGHSQLLLSTSTSAQEIWGEFEGDFGHDSISHLIVTPDLLTGAAFHLAVPEDHVVTTVNVSAVLTGKATLVRWAEGPDLAASAWLAHQDTLAIELSPAAGQKTIYLQMRNDWADSPILTDYAVMVARGVEVAFIAPPDGAVLQSGVNLQMRGTAFGGGAAVDSVKVDQGDGNFVDVTGLESWSRMWNLPVVIAPTELTLRARAWAGTDSATTVIGVTVAP